MSQPKYTPVSFVSPISETTRPNPSSTISQNKPLYARISTYLSDAFTLEDKTLASRRESIISDHGGQEAENIRRASIVSTRDQQQDQALQQWRRHSVDNFWARHGSVSEDGRRRSIISQDGERSGQSRSIGGSDAARWRRMSWGVKTD